MKAIKNALIVLIIFLVSSTNNYSSAQTAPAAMIPKPKAVQAGADKKPETDPQPAQKSGICDCLKGAIDAIQKSYVSLEEDEWPSAIKATKDAINTINALSKTCTCPETIAYQKIADAYLKYAEGGNHLDGAEEPNCPYATKLYSDATDLLESYIPKISNATVKENAEDVKEYVKEEKEFVDEECGGTQPQEKPKGAETKKQ